MCCDKSKYNSIKGVRKKVLWLSSFESHTRIYIYQFGLSFFYFVYFWYVQHLRGVGGFVSCGSENGGTDEYSV